MKTSDVPPRRVPISRRAALRTLGAGAVAVPIVGCGAPTAPIAPDSSIARTDAGIPVLPDARPDDDAGSPVADAGLDAALDAPSDAAPPPPDTRPPPRDAGALAWAVGGTAAMVDAASYPDPFAGASGSSCALTLPATLGPCFYTSPIRRDVSEGYPGLPVRLALRVVDASCAPLSGARVDIWHTGNAGLYSGGPVTTCTRGDADAIAHLYFRGSQITDDDGQVAFDTCFPGWYAGRAIHIHFQVVLADASTATVVAQLYFAQSVVDEIFEVHPEYAPFGTPDRTNEGDGIYRGVGASALLEHERMSDGAMLAWKQLVVSTD
jgi:protocatechuate 3,4-dioxygenase beta subunit